MTLLEKKLRLVAKIKYFSVFNLASYESSRADGAMLQPRKDIKNWLADGLIVPIIKTGASGKKDKAKNTFYRLTKKGYNASGEGKDRPITERISSKVESTKHRTAKIDIAVSFCRNFPDWDIEFEYEYNAGKRSDILVKMSKGNLIRQFWVEIDIKENGARTYHEKVVVLDEFFDKTRPKFKDFGLDYNTQILIIYLDSEYDVFQRKQEIDPKQIKALKKRFDVLVRLSKVHPARFRFLMISNYWQINKKVWEDSNGNLTNLIN